MKIVNENIVLDKAIGYDLTRICPNLEQILFVDIETTGLSAKTAGIYLIGCAYYENGNWHLQRWFAQNYEEEILLLTQACEFAKKFKKLVHFNGNRFDIPFIKARCEKYEIEDVFGQMDSLDIYKKVQPYKTVFGVPDCKQKTIELFLGIDREDIYSGGELIEVYKNYTKSQDKREMDILLLHNADDVRGMFGLLPVLVYDDFFRSIYRADEIKVNADDPEDIEYPELPIRAVKVTGNTYEDINGQRKSEIYMKIALGCELPSSIGANIDGCFFEAKGNQGTIRVPIISGEMKYFYSNYKDYYYLPDEDQALHKSIAEFVDKGFREPAKASNCYTRKEGRFLRQWRLMFTPFFKTSYESKEMYFDLNDKIKTSRNAMSLYAINIIAHILTC